MLTSLPTSVYWQYFDLDEFGNKLGADGIAIADAEPVLDVEGAAGGVGGGPMLNQPWVMPEVGMGGVVGDNKGGSDINAVASVPGSKIPTPVPGVSAAASPRDVSHPHASHEPGTPSHNPEYQAKHDLHMQAIEKAAQNVTNPHHNPLQLTSDDQGDDTLPYR